MALVARLRSEQPLRWEIQLGQALSQFQDTLTSEQRASFLANRIHSSATPPTIRDVMNTTAEVDRQARRDKKGNHQCFGPRFTRFLEVVQQYASIGDVLIGGFQNLIACGVWSVVRVTLLTVCKFSSYLERVSRLFMDIGQSVPQIHDIANLYPDSRALQALVAEYFLGVVKLCQKLISLYKQSMTEQLKSFFRDWDVAGQDTELAKSSRAIYEQLQVEHAQTSSSSLSTLNSLSSRKRTRQAQKDHRRLLDACSTYNYMSAWKRTRKIGYSTWDFCKTEYRAWISNLSSSTLILRGKLGGGKSVVLANMVDDLNLKQAGSKVIYFFCKEDDAISLELRTIVGCLCRQLFQLLQPGETVEWTGSLTHPDSDDLLSLLRKVLPPHEKIFVILDGIDSCDLKEENELLAWIQSLQDHLTLALCISCRLDASSIVGRNMEGLKNPVWVTLPDNRPEISEYIKDQLARKIQSGELKFRDPSIPSSIEESLLSGCQGMFLWVHLQLQSNSQEQTDEAILDALSSLPRTLPDLFHQILHRHRERSPKYQTPVLKLLSTSFRPLFLSELEEALSVVPGVTNPESDQLVNNIRAVLASCGGLVVVDEEQHTAHFVHHSVNQYLSDASVLKQNNQNASHCFTREDAYRWMGDLVVTYLSWDRLNFAVASTPGEIEQPIDNIPGRVLKSTLLASLPTTIGMRASRLSSRYLTQIQPSGTKVPILKVHTESPAAPGFFFQRYAEEYWLHHTKSMHESSTLMWDLFTQLASKRWLVTGALLWKDRPPVEPEDQTNWACYHSHTSMLVRNIDSLDSTRLLRIKLMSIVPVLYEAIEVLCGARTKLKQFATLSVNLTALHLQADDWNICSYIDMICDIHRQQMRYLKAELDVETWGDIFQSSVRMAILYYIIREFLSERYTFAFESIFKQLNKYELALQSLYETAASYHLKRWINLAIYAIQMATNWPAGVNPNVLVSAEVEALILHVNEWEGFPITKAGLINNSAPLTTCQVLQKGDFRTAPLMSRGYIYVFSNYLLFVRSAEESAWPKEEEDQKFPFWHCQLDQVLSLIDLSHKGFGRYELRTAYSSSIIFTLSKTGHGDWLKMALPFITIDTSALALEQEALFAGWDF